MVCVGIAQLYPGTGVPRDASGDGREHLKPQDRSVQAGVRRLAAQELDTYPRLDVLINNAGGFWAHRGLTTEHTFALNHLAPID